MAFVHAPAVVNRNPHLIHLFQHEPERLDCSLEHRGVSHVEDELFTQQHAPRLDGLLNSLLAQPNIGPASKPVLFVPCALAVAQQYELFHLGFSHLSLPLSHAAHGRAVRPQPISRVARKRGDGPAGRLYKKPC